jgi:predicted metalloprotease with PDZ domain
MAATPIEYFIRPTDPLGHYFEVDVIIWQPHSVQQVQMPAWIPGSYMLRDFSRHIVEIHAYAINDKLHLTSPLKMEAIDSHTWEIQTTKNPILVRTKIYAFDSSVRTAYLDQLRGFYNHSSLCLQAIGFTDHPCLIHIEKAAWMNSWTLLTSMPVKRVTKHGFGTYQVQNYDELIDHPVSLGYFQIASWKAFGIDHHMAIQGANEIIDTARLAKDLKAITESQIAFFDPKSHLAPFQSYLFHVNVSAHGYGGLEHRNSTALLCKRTDLPYQHLVLSQKSYEDFLGLCSHEYFHAWNVKNIQPAVFQPYQLQTRNHTRLLWLFEGFTSYYDDLHLLRSGVISLDTYLERLSKTIQQVLSTTGRLKQSVAGSSFDAWTKYYVMDENSPNTVVSYYAKGSLIALALDLMIRDFTQHQQSLDDVMRCLWNKHGDIHHIPPGLKEDGFKEIVLEAIGAGFASSWNQFEKRYIYGTEDLPLQALFLSNHYRLEEQSLPLGEIVLKRLGMRTTSQESWVKVTHVMDDGGALLAGIAAGDLLVSINRERITPSNLNSLLERFAGQSFKLMVFRQDILHECAIKKDQRVFSKWQIQAATP